MANKRSAFAAPVNTFYALIGSASILIVLGLVMVFSASSIHAIDTKGYAFAIVLRQALFLVAGVFAVFFLAKLSLAKWELLAKFGLVLAIIAVALVMVPGLGKTVNGNRNWITLKVIDIQPGEFAKFLLILWASLLLARKERNKNLKFNAPALLMPGFLLVMAIIMKGGDLGTTSVIGAIMIGLLFISGVDIKKMGYVAGAASIALAVGIASSAYRKARFLVFLNPFSPAQYKNIGWQPAHSLLGLASGGLFGVGLGGSRQKWGNLAEAHTDFIFSVIGEELGLVGTVSVLLLFAVLIFAIFKIALRAKDPFSRYVSAGIACWIGIQAILNIGTAISVLPVVGVTLPLVSYGGSALITTLFALGFVIGVALRDKEISQALVARFAKK
jgi:cell division protein FtsW